MITWLEWAIAVAALLLVLLAAVYVIRGRPSDDLLLGGVVLVELALLAQLVIGLVALGRTTGTSRRSPSSATWSAPS